MKSTAVDVASYIDEQPEAWRDALARLRAACRDQLHGYSEAMVYGMPSYSREGQVEVGFAKQARYLSLYVLQQPVLDANRRRLEGLDVGKGCIRYRQPHQIDWAVVNDLLAETAAGDAEIC